MNGWFLGVPLVGSLLNAAVAVEDIDVATTIKTLKQAQTANEGCYPSGRMHVRFQRDAIDKAQPKESAYEVIDAQVSWVDDHIRTELKRWGPSPTPPEIDPKKAEREICLLDRKSQTLFGFGDRVMVVPTAKKSIPFEYSMSPKTLWYQSQLFGNNPCLIVFDREHFSPPLGPDVQIAASRLAGCSIQMVRRDTKTDGTATAEFSYALDGTPQIYQSRIPTTRFQEDDQFKWKRDPQGRVYLAELTRLKISTVRGRDYEVRERVEITDFEPGHRPSLETFTLRSLPLDQETLIMDKVADRTYRLRDLPAHSITPELEQLIESMKQRGFAPPSRP